MADRDIAAPAPDETFLGRAEERAVLDRLAASVHSGQSQVLVVRGDAGIGKTALLDHLAGAGHGLAVSRLSGAEAEANLPFAAIQRLAHSAGAIQDSLPAPQRAALRVAIGIAAGPPPDRFLIGLAVHSLLEGLAGERPLLLLVDDTQWLDQESIDAPAFAARRLDNERVRLVIGHRRDPSVMATGGNPLAIIDLVQELSTHQLVGLTLLPEPLPVGSHLEAHYLRQTQAFPTEVQTWLLLAAAEPTGDPAYVASAAPVLGIDVHAADLAETANLVTIGAGIEFRHPLVRSAIYSGATDLADGPFFGANRKGAKPSRGVRDAFWLQGMQACHRNALECITAFPATDFRPDLDRIDLPTLVIHGDDDQVRAVRSGRQGVASRITGGVLKVYPGAPHGITETHKEELSGDLSHFSASGRNSCLWPGGRQWR